MQKNFEKQEKRSNKNEPFELRLSPKSQGNLNKGSTKSMALSKRSSSGYSGINSNNLGIGSNKTKGKNYFPSANSHVFQSQVATETGYFGFRKEENNSQLLIVSRNMDLDVSGKESRLLLSNGGLFEDETEKNESGLEEVDRLFNKFLDKKKANLTKGKRKVMSKSFTSDQIPEKSKEAQRKSPSGNEARNPKNEEKSHDNQNQRSVLKSFLRNHVSIDRKKSKEAQRESKKTPKPLDSKSQRVLSGASFTFSPKKSSPNEKETKREVVKEPEAQKNKGPLILKKQAVAKKEKRSKSLSKNLRKTQEPKKKENERKSTNQKRMKSLSAEKKKGKEKFELEMPKNPTKKDEKTPENDSVNLERKPALKSGVQGENIKESLPNKRKSRASTMKTDSDKEEKNSRSIDNPKAPKSKVSRNRNDSPSQKDSLKLNGATTEREPTNNQNEEVPLKPNLASGKSKELQKGKAVSESIEKKAKKDSAKIHSKPTIKGPENEKVEIPSEKQPGHSSQAILKEKTSKSPAFIQSKEKNPSKGESSETKKRPKSARKQSKSNGNHQEHENLKEERQKGDTLSLLGSLLGFENSDLLFENLAKISGSEIWRKDPEIIEKLFGSLDKLGHVSSKGSKVIHDQRRIIQEVLRVFKDHKPKGRGSSESAQVPKTGMEETEKKEEEKEMLDLVNEKNKKPMIIKKSKRKKTEVEIKEEKPEVNKKKVADGKEKKVAVEKKLKEKSFFRMSTKI